MTPAQLLIFFVQLLPRRALHRLPALQNANFYQRLFTPMVTLWYLLFQRLHHDHSLDAALADARAGGANRLRPGLSRKLCSNSTASYSDARQRLPAQFLGQVLALQGRKIASLNPSTSWKGLSLALLDGTTVRLRPFGDIAHEFAGHRNQNGAIYWCLMRAVVCFCALSGAALDCATGSLHVGEQALGCAIILQAAGSYLFIADRNFGVFRIAQAARHAKQHVLLRLTNSRAIKLLGRQLGAGDYRLNWKCTCRDQMQADASTDPIPGRLIVRYLERPGFRAQWICLFTTLEDQVQYPADELLRVYGVRWHIELNLRYIKTQMDAEELQSHSTEIARKEWLATLLAYNLIRAATLCAALNAGVQPLSLSFSACRRRLESWLLHHLGKNRAVVLTSWSITLIALSRCRLPRRRKPRPNEPRAQRHLREPYPPLVGTRADARKKLENQDAKS